MASARVGRRGPGALAAAASSAAAAPAAPSASRRVATDSPPRIEDRGSDVVVGPSAAREGAD
eukprot:5940239-Pyramimonas_sp.AAC.1